MSVNKDKAERLASQNKFRPVAVTGMGIISCIGNSLEEVTASLMVGKSGIVFDEERKQKGFRSPLTGKINNFNPKELGLSRKVLRSMCEPALYSWAAANDAVKDADLLEEHLKNNRCGIVFGNDSTIKAGVEAIEHVHKYGETHFIGAGSIFRVMNSTATMNLAAFFGIGGANWTLSAACASSAHAIGQALMLIRGGFQDIVITGGVQETNWMSMASFDSIGAFSTNFDFPEEASRPFDAFRDGLVPSGGAACLIIEDLEHAKKRNANIYCMIGGYGFSTCAGQNLSSPGDKGLIVAMGNALSDSGLSRSQIDYINAHATSTPIGDLAEAVAINKLFGDKVPVSSTKSMTGHECWMSGASEAIYTILMARNGFLAPNINFTEFQDDFPKINVVRQKTSAEIKYALSNSFGFGGTNASVLFDFDI
jgi:3-oxoacyl-[acyl-carrier-protein] synthase-1